MGEMKFKKHIKLFLIATVLIIVLVATHFLKEKYHVEVKQTIEPSSVLSNYCSVETSVWVRDRFGMPITLELNLRDNVPCGKVKIEKEKQIKTAKEFAEFVKEHLKNYKNCCEEMK